MITVGGELDLMTDGELEEFVRRARRRGDQVVVDLAGTAFMDCSGLSALLRVRREVGCDGGVIRLCAPDRRPARVLRLTGVDRLLPVDASLERSLAAVVAAGEVRRRSCRPKTDGLKAGEPSSGEGR
ncbi:hypothetical protein GCM10029978_045930 [Actinoallomurus acanthiterrae]